MTTQVETQIETQVETQVEQLPPPPECITITVDDATSEANDPNWIMFHAIHAEVDPIIAARRVLWEF